MKKLLPLAALIAACMLMLSGCQNQVKPTDPGGTEGGLVFTTGGEQGTYYRFGQVLAGKISETTPTKLSVTASGGSKENIEAVQSGKAVIGFAQTDVLSFNTSDDIMAGCGRLFPFFAFFTARTA